MQYHFHNEFTSYQSQVSGCINDFNEKGRVFGKANRNTIKIFHLEDLTINIKSFKVPNVVNKIAYRFFRKSKAQRSFEYAKHLISKNIGTPQPIAYFEEISPLAFSRSYYVSEHLHYDLTFRELVHDEEFPDRKKILKAFTRFTYELHEKRIEFLDHSPGNTLIQVNNGVCQFFLVDLNRMNFRELDFDARMKNFSRLTPKRDMVTVMAQEYAVLYGKPESEVFKKMWFYTESFQEKFQRKKKLKRKLKFWKRN